MAKSTAIITDKNFRITIPYEIRIAEDLKQGDIIEIDIVKYIGMDNEIDRIKESIETLTNLVMKQSKLLEELEIIKKRDIETKI